MQSGIHSARELIEALRLKLLAPALESADGSVAILTEAMSCLQSSESQMLDGETMNDTADRDDTRRELEALRRDLHRVRKLVDNAAVFYAGWAKLLASMTGGYTATGDPAPLAASGTVLLRG